MEFYEVFVAVTSKILAIFLCFVTTLAFYWWVLPNQKLRSLKRSGFGGPSPSFPHGNAKEMKRKESPNSSSSSAGSSHISHDIHSTISPYYASWQKSYGKVFVYWLGTEPFLYVADPEFLKKMNDKVLAKTWGKPSVFRNDRFSMFGNGLVMAEGTKWVEHRHVIAPTFSPLNLKSMGGMMVESARKMIDRWTTQINSGNPIIDVEREVIATAGEIIAKASFGMGDGSGKEVFEKLRTLQLLLFKTNRYVGVPFAKYFFSLKKTLEAKKLGEEIDKLLLSIIKSRIRQPQSQQDLLGHLLGEKKNNESIFSMRELVDECKTFFFGGYETTALSISWTLLILSVHQDWQEILREEIKEVVGDVIDRDDFDTNLLADLKKMKCVMNEALRLYPSSPNVQRQAKQDIKVDDNLTVPNGTNVWIDVVAIHHDPKLWGEDANEFRPERFKDDANGGCNHKMGYLPFGFGGRACVGRNLTFLEYKVVLSLLLSKFRFTLSPGYHHAPTIMLSLRPTNGLPLIVQPL